MAELGRKWSIWAKFPTLPGAQIGTSTEGEQKEVQCKSAVLSAPAQGDLRCEQGLSKALALPGSSSLEPGAFRDTCPELIASDLSGGPDNATSSVLDIQTCSRGRCAISLLKTELLQRFGSAGAWFMCRVGFPLAGEMDFITGVFAWSGESEH